MDRKLGAHVPVPMFRVVERVARGLHRLYLVSQNNVDFGRQLCYLVVWWGPFCLHATGLLRATGGRARSENVQRALEAG